MTDTIIGAFIGVGGAIIGVIIAGPVTYFFSRRLIRESHSNNMSAIYITEFNKAAAEFRVAFIEEQRLLDPNSFADKASAGSASSILKGAINKHEVAMIKFEPFICKSKIEEYKQVWREYAGESKHFEQYTGDTILKKEKRRKLALSRIEKLLQFAEPKH